MYFSGFVGRAVYHKDVIIKDDLSLRSIQSQSVPELICDLLEELVLPTSSHIYFTKKHLLLQYELNSKITSIICNEPGICYNVLEWFRDTLFIVCDLYGKQVIKIYSECDGTYDAIHTCFKISSLSIGKTIALVLTHDGKVYQCKNIICEAKLLFAEENLLLLESVSTIKKICCGREHGIALTNDGIVYTIGGGWRGQLGLGVIDSADILTKVDLLEPLKVKDIAAGGWHCLVISDSGDLYGWGWNESGQIGVIKEDSDESEEEILSFPKLLFSPSLVDTPIEQTFISVSAGSRHSSAVSSNGLLFSWGWNGYGQLMHGDFLNKLKPQLVKSLCQKSLFKVVCGKWSTVVM
ncbi:RCC1 domain-containing protein 1 [Hydra vulgaris]|uniref:RCC1 domain-containing protein 1 n=1 Tax=Hydra vulgaris TaxID=6087 RepID=A0ABM4C0J1_HYDVU